MEKQTSSFFSRLMWIIFIAMGIFLGFYAFFADASTRTLPWGATRDNANYLNSTFWANNPTSGDIVKALYGSGSAWSAYTTNRSGYTSGTCLASGMNVIYVPAWSYTLPLILSDNTIYVLTGKEYMTTWAIDFWNCTSLISQTWSMIFSTWQLINATLTILLKQNTIIDALALDWMRDGLWSIHAKNDNGIRYISSNNNTMNAIQTSNNWFDGIYLDTSLYNQLNNIQSYNNLEFGIFLNASSNNMINNIQAYNNIRDGINLWASSRYNTLNNIQAYNNTHGIRIQTWSDYTILNNIQTYNNFWYGIYLNAASNALLNSVQSYNNITWIYLDPSATWNQYYSTWYLFWNVANLWWSGENLTWGTWIYAPSLWRVAGQLMTGWTLSWNHIANPINGSGNHLLSWNSWFNALLWFRYTWSDTGGVLYSIGWMISRQQQPVMYSGTALITWWVFNAAKFIGSTVNFLSWNVIVNAYTNSSGINTTVITSGSMNFRIFGNDITGEKIWISAWSLTTWILLSGADGPKNIFLQLSTWSTRATHYQTTTILDTTLPAFTWTTVAWTFVMSWIYYSTTGITITFFDANVSSVVVSGLNINYYSGTFTSGSTLTWEWTYRFTIADLALNSTGMIFSIDTTAPLLMWVSSGAYYTTNKTITWSDIIAFSGFVLNGIGYTWSSLMVTGDGVRMITGYDKAGNASTGISFIIDKTYPLFTGTVVSWSAIVSWWYYNTTGITIAFTDIYLSWALVSGLTINYYSGMFVSGSTLTGDWTYRFTVFDIAGNTTGITFTIDTTNPIITGNYPTSGLNITGGNTINFSRSGSDTNISGYTLTINSTGYSTTGNTYQAILPNGTYAWNAMIADRAGNTGISATLPFMITTPLSGNVTLNTGNMQYNANRYTKDYISLYLQPNQPCNYLITGNVNPIISGTTLGAITLNSYLGGSDGLKTVYVIFTNTSWEIITKTVTAYLDTSTPAPILSTPASGTSANGAFNLMRSTLVDGGVGLSGYQYFVSTTGTFATVVKSGSTASTVITAAIGNVELWTSGTFYRYVKAIDKLGNIWSSSIQSFYYSGVADTIPDVFILNATTNAALNTLSPSNIITITWLSANTPVLASITTWVLYISGNMVWKTGYVQNGWTVKIELISSSNYNTTITSTLTIGWVSSLFNVTTSNSNGGTNYSDIPTNLSNTEKLQIIAIFEALRDLYGWDKEIEFINSLMVMLQSKINGLGTSTDDTNNRNVLQYLYDLVNQYRSNISNTNTDISSTSWIINNIYTAPNGKRYTITYDSGRRQFTSTNFLTPKYFPTLDVLKYTIDINNIAGSTYTSAHTILARWGRVSIDGTRQTSPYTAPNRKVFYFFKTIEGQYSSYTFTAERYFDSLEWVKEYIYNNNKK